MKRLIILVVAALVLATVFAGGAEERTFTASCDGSLERYVEIVPDGFLPANGALIALHGHGSDRHQFAEHPRGECEAAREAAAKRGMLFISPDYRAKTSWMGPKAERDILDLIGILRKERGIERLYFCGGSMGGTSALTFAVRHPDLVAGVVALNPLADHLSYGKFQDAIAESFGGDKNAARDEYYSRSALNYPERFVMPVSITVGGADKTVPPESARELAKRIAFRRPDLIYFDEVASRGHATDLAASRKAFDEMFSRATAQVPRFRDNTIRLAAVNSSAPDREAADFRCIGENDEAVFNRAVELLPLGGRIVLADGDYYFDACTNEGGSAVFLGYNGGRGRVITFAGVTDSKAYNTRYGAGIHVTEKAMRAMSASGVYRVFFGSPRKPPRGEFGPYPGDFYTYTHVNNLRLENLQILFANASKPLRGVDGSNFGSLYMRKVYIYQESYFRDRFMHIGRPDIPIAGTVGVWSVPSSNDEAAEIRYDHVQVGGLHTGFVFSGVDHLIMEVSGACRCVQGYDFRVGAKTLTLINCCDEGCTYLPRFRGRSGHVTMVDFNIERFNEKFIPVDPEGDRGEHRATEDVPGSWHGTVSYTLQGGAFGFAGHGEARANPFWAPGHGSGMKTVDQNSAPVHAADIVIYGSTPAAISAAVQAKRMGKSAVIVSPETRIGGLTTGGLGQTDIGNKSAFGGIAREFYHDVAVHYRKPGSWRWEQRSDYIPDGQCKDTLENEAMWTFEPSAALKILEGWERRDGLVIHRGKRLDRRDGKVKKENGRIVSFLTEDGIEYRGKMFIDATYEGDLMAAAGVTYTVGREANSVYGETISGIALEADGVWNHNLNDGVSAYVKAGDRSSGLLPGIEPYNPREKAGDGDKRVQAYCFRMCLTDVPENRIPFVKPANYDERNYELLFRDYEAAWAKGGVRPVGARVWKDARGMIPFIMSRMPNRKTDSNNRCGVSSDFIGRNWNWPEGSYAERERMLKEHLDYQMGLMWTLANHPRIPAEIREYFSKYGTCRDEFSDGLGNGWQSQLYVREARRMVGEYVMTELNCRHSVTAERPVALGAYGMDSHHVRRMETREGFVRNEGNVEDYHFPGPYRIDYGAIVPKRAECANLLVPVCVSASHMAFGSIRMEPVFFALGQAAGTAASLSVDDGVPVQDLDYGKLRSRLVGDGQRL